MKPIFLIVFSVLMLSLALTTILPARQVIVWKLSLLATEFGHWFALASIVLLSVSIVNKTSASWVVVPFLLLSLVLFSRPVVQASMHQESWKTELKRSLGQEPPVLFSFQRLFSTGKKPVNPENYVFLKTSEGELTLDFYRAKTNSPAPWVVVIHGGGWDSGDRKQLSDLNSELVASGISVAAISYRLVPQAKWPAQRDDSFAAVSYLKAHASELGIDPTRWAVLGRSAGGQIAEAVAFQSNDPTLKGLVAFHSPADLQFAYDFSEERDIINSRDLLKRYVGGDPTQVPEMYKDSSPINFVNRRSPPSLLIHGANDPLTWVEQSRRLHAKMEKEGAVSAYLEFPWATHAFDYTLNGPAGQISTNAVKSFLTTVLRRPQ